MYNGRHRYNIEEKGHRYNIEEKRQFRSYKQLDTSEGNEDPKKNLNKTVKNDLKSLIQLIRLLWTRLNEKHNGLLMVIRWLFDDGNNDSFIYTSVGAVLFSSYTLFLRFRHKIA